MDVAPRDPIRPGPDEIVGWTLVQAYHQVAGRFRAVFSAAGLTPHQFGVLVQLSIEPDISQAALARKIVITPQSMGALLQQMERDGLVSMPSPGRRGTSRPALLTRGGQRKLASTFPEVERMNAAENLGLTEAEAHTLNTLLHKVHGHLAPASG